MASRAPKPPTITAFNRQELLVEFANIRSYCPAGVYLAASKKTPQIWYGVIFVRKGPYTGGVFRFILFFSEDYPYDLPTLKLLSRVPSHPLVHPHTHEFDFSHVENELSDIGDSSFRQNGRVLAGRVLSYFKRSFKSAVLDSVPGVYQRDRKRFALQAALDVKRSRDAAERDGSVEDDYSWDGGIDQERLIRFVAISAVADEPAEPGPLEVDPDTTMDERDLQLLNDIKAAIITAEA
ncbi:uncharacterized protein V1510DRAFT_422231 [Dipodascopsis tothii]|uniref:uncharacterized protein n=1 Tax=Dipodascopsis tothii TaxID=44089 RepID=UPI0034CDD3CC